MIRNQRCLYLFIVVFLCLVTRDSIAQISPSFYDFVRSDLNWRTLESDHFLVHYHVSGDSDAVTRSASVVQRIAEEIYLPITSLYKNEPDTKVSIVLKDYEDYSNGAAYFFDNKIDIWLPSLDSPLRGDHNWLRNVITHEFTHIIQVQKTMKAGRRTPIAYFQWLDYEDVRRPDVLYGYPNKIVSYPIPVINNPAWLAEGTAQFQRSGLHYDSWDSHRDMLLRTRVVNGEELSLGDMATFFSKTSLERESIYNHGFAFSSYLAQRFGEDILRSISEELGKWRNWNVEKAIKAATGLDANLIHSEWIAELRKAYGSSLDDIASELVEGDLLESVGFNNHFPKLSPDGKKLAYLSNKGEDNNFVSLYVVDRSNEDVSYEINDLDAVHDAFCSHGSKIKSGLGSGYDWHPDGKSIIYSKLVDGPTGARLSELFSLNLESKKSERLTSQARAAMPSVSPNGEHVVFVTQYDGTTNLSRLDLETKSITALTNFRAGEQVFNPSYHPSGEVVFFSTSRDGKRDIYKVSNSGGEVSAILATKADERSPVVSNDGNSIIYSSDENGIFNLFSLDLKSGEKSQLSQVLGGAFEPDVDSMGEIVFARYDVEGYKIARLEGANDIDESYRYVQPAAINKEEKFAKKFEALNTADDSDLATGLSDQAPGKDYDDTFTSFQFYPVLRLDQYATGQNNRVPSEIAREFQGGQFLRNTKAGFYVASREILDGLSFFGGLLVGPTTREWDGLGDFLAPGRLVKLERDAFLQIDFNRGIPFLKKKWSPQLSIELFNIRRNVESGLEIEEFPCTACFPSKTFADIAFSIWEVNLFSRSKINRSSLLEFGLRYSPYRARTEAFYSQEYSQSIGASSTKYFIGRGVSVKYYFEAIHPRNNSDVIPEGLKVSLGYDYEPGRLLDRFDVDPDQGILLPKYSQFNNHKLFADLRYVMQLPGSPLGGAHGLGLRAVGSTILGGEVDDFFNDYVGGLVGARGYPFYALGGNETIWLQASYQFPIISRMRKQFMFLNFDKLYGRVYADAARAWSSGGLDLGDLKKDLGGEMRLGMGSFYLFPTALFASATYGFDQFNFGLDDGFVSSDNESFVSYGKEWQIHFGVLFGFDL